ncbi:MAG: TAXI family TRAP transporter solute-binding subunit [Deltaproteobacteria bacterium]|nr:TAXI family TRAP transporter solute-binding subunit [Deltaproteobacteria bacterium]
MKNYFFKFFGAACAFLLLLQMLAATASAREIYTFGGGPAGGTFQFMAAGISIYEPVKEITEFRVVAKASAGSVENLRKVDSGKFAMGVVYSGELYMGRNGQLQDDSAQYENVLAVSYLYGAPAQLVVRKNSGIRKISQLAGSRVGVGNAGSGAYANCERLLSHLELWDKIKRNAMGYNDAALAFGSNQLDAFWVFVGFPSGAVLMAAQNKNIDLVDLYNDAEASGFFKKYPFFSRVVIPAGTYPGIDRDVNSYQDSALWVANKDVPEDVIYKLLSAIYTEEGLAHMSGVNNAASAMNVPDGIKGVVTPLHPGALKFWKEKGLM